MLEKKKEELGEAGRSLAAQEPSPKQPCANLWESFSEILEKAGTSPTDFRSEVDIDKYLPEPLLKFHTTATHGGQRTRSAFLLWQNWLSVISLLHLHLSLLSGFSLVLERYTTISAIDLHLRGQKHSSSEEGGHDVMS